MSEKTGNMQAHINDQFALNLQNKGITLADVAKELFGYEVVTTGAATLTRTGDNNQKMEKFVPSETYLVNPLTQGFQAIVADGHGVEHLVSPFRGKRTTNIIDFVRDHKPELKSTIDVNDFLLAWQKKRQAPAAA